MKTWFITGISRGLGAALAETVLSLGDTVVGTVREELPEIASGSGALHVLNLDLANPSAIRSSVVQALSFTGRIDVLVNNAGYGLLGALEEATDAEMDHLFAVHVFGPIRLIRAALPWLREQGSGHIVNITSIAGRAPVGSSALYAAAKAAVEAMSQSLSQEVTQFGLKVTAVAPGAVRTDFLSGQSFRRSKSLSVYAGSVGKAAAYLGSMDGKQPGDPARVAKAIVRLIEAPDPPVHLLLGSDALQRYRDKLDAVAEEVDRWEDLTCSTDFAD